MDGDELTEDMKEALAKHLIAKQTWDSAREAVKRETQEELSAKEHFDSATERSKWAKEWFDLATMKLRWAKIGVNLAAGRL